MLGGHTRVSKSIDDREVKAWWVCRTQDVGRTKAKTWVESTWNRVKGGGHLLGKSDGVSGWRGSPPERTQGRQGEVSAGGGLVRHVQRSHSSGLRC